MSDVDPTDWRSQAACRGTLTSVFFPEDGSLGAADAKAVCWGREGEPECPVRVDCLEFALATSGSAGRYGVWGGYTETERRRIAGKRNRRADRKRCTDCGEIKPASEFHEHRPGTLRSRCRLCFNQRQKVYNARRKQREGERRRSA
jgi:WhiB family redox-sensing transcriptional regulator